MLLPKIVGRLTRSLPLPRSHELPVYVASPRPLHSVKRRPLSWRLTQTPYSSRPRRQQHQVSSLLSLHYCAPVRPA
jgi:hypothetical protein